MRDSRGFNRWGSSGAGLGASALSSSLQQSKGRAVLTPAPQVLQPWLRRRRVLCSQSMLPGNGQQSPKVVSPRAVCFPPCCHVNTHCVVGWWLCPTSAPDSLALLAFRVRDSWPPSAASWWLSIEGELELVSASMLSRGGVMSWRTRPRLGLGVSGAVAPPLPVGSRPFRWIPSCQSAVSRACRALALTFTWCRRVCISNGLTQLPKRSPPVELMGL